MFPKALNLYLGTSGAKPWPRRLSLLSHLYLPANSSSPECDCLFLFMFRQTAEMILQEKIYKKDYFLLRWWSIESVPEISLPPCISLQLLHSEFHYIWRKFDFLFFPVIFGRKRIYPPSPHKSSMIFAVLRIRDVYPGSWILPIPDPKTAKKDRGEKNQISCHTFFVAINFTKLYIIRFLKCWKKILG